MPARRVCVCVCVGVFVFVCAKCFTQIEGNRVHARGPWKTNQPSVAP